MRELTPERLGRLDELDAGLLAAWQQASDLLDKDVVDVNGQPMGKVACCFADDAGGAIVRCDVALSDRAKRLLGVERNVAGVPATWISSIGERDVRLRKPAEEVLSLDASNDGGGARELPRKNR